MSVSEFGSQINRNILRQMGLHKASNRELARMLDCSINYVTARTNEDCEWAPRDIEALSLKWNIPKEALLGADDDTSLKTPEPEPLSDEDALNLVLKKLKTGDLTLALSSNPNNYEERQGGDGR